MSFHYKEKKKIKVKRILTLNFLRFKKGNDDVESALT